MAINSKSKPPIPKLRFPEFKDGPGWAEKSFADLYAFKSTNTFSRDKLNYEGGTIRNIHYGDIHTRFQTLFDIKREHVPFVTNGSADDFDEDAFCTEGDLVFADASEDLNDVGKCIEIVALHGERVLSGTHTILATRRDAQLIVGFGGYLFRSERMREQIRMEAQGSKVYGIAAGRLSNVKVSFPPKEEEQRKISACLTSLDEWIAAEGRKLEALRAHKKGLMQQLFPREGETAPYLRFRAFRKDAAWKPRALGEMLVETPRPVEMIDNADYSLVTVKRRYGGVISRGAMKGRAILVKSQFLVRTDDFLISKRQIVHDACGLVPEALQGSIVSNEYCVMTPKPGCDIRFFNFFAQQPCVSRSFMQASVGIVIEKMLFKLSDWLKMEFLFPSFEEQQQIAACLSSLDVLIYAQSRKIDGLKAHKKGLMQRLFPSPEGV